jgi:putative ABC transport system permease protein
MNWRRFFHRDKADSDHGEEFRCHLEIEIDENIARGMSPDEARREACAKFGSPTLIREEVYHMNRIGILDPLARDFRYAARMLRRNPGFTAAAMLCLALGIGATTAIFSVVNAVLLRPLPYAHAERLVRLYTAGQSKEPQAGKFWFSGPEYFTLKREARSFESVEAWLVGGANVTGGQEPIRPTVAYVTGGLLPSLGVAPLRGRLITPADDSPTAPYTAVISYGLWQRVLGGDPAAIGRDLLFSGRKCTVVGIMPPGFQFPPGEADPPDIWAPAQIDPARPGSAYSHYLSAAAVLRPGLTIDAARSEMRGLLQRIEAETRGSVHLGPDPREHGIAMFSFQDEVVGGARTAILVLLGAVVFVLLIACVNVANLLLARAETRRREIAVRKAIGASLPVLVRQFLSEGILLSLGGSALGLGLAFVGMRLLTSTNAGDIPRASEIGINWGILAFTLFLCVTTGIAFGLAPIAQLAARNLHDTLRAASARNTATVSATRFRQALVVGELALALVLLIGTGLMIRAFWKLQQVEIGVNPHNLLTMTTTLPGAAYPQPERVLQFWTDLRERVSAMPGVVSASVMAGLPPLRRLDSNTTFIEGYTPPSGRPGIEIDFYQTAGPRYFETMGIPLLEGRLFDPRDGPDALHVVIANQTLARTVWPHESALGHRVRVGAGPWATIVGVAGDVKNAGVDHPTGTELYFPHLQAGGNALRAAYLVIRTNSQASALAGPARAAIRALDPSLPVNKVRELEDVIASVQSRPRFLAVLLTMFATAALVLASIGIYGVISYSVAQRTSEFGIRIAMGAVSSDVLRIVLRQGLSIAAVGLVLGFAGAFSLTRFLTGVLFGVSTVDPGTFVAMAVLMAAVAMLACYIPARRATRVDPATALRHE